MLQILLEIRHMKFSLADASDLAKKVLVVFSYTTKYEILQRFYELTALYPEVRSIYLKYARPFYEQKRQTTLNIMRKYMAVGDIDHAVAVAKRGVNYEA